MADNGLFCNYGPGKTAAIAAFRGQGAKAARERHLSTASPSLVLPSRHGPKPLSITFSYKHMGG
eukprot:15443830-Alexandrium_andersonii.AAC.1